MTREAQEVFGPLHKMLRRALIATDTMIVTMTIIVMTLVITITTIVMAASLGCSVNPVRTKRGCIPFGLDGNIMGARKSKKVCQ